MLYYQRPSQQFLSHDGTDSPFFVSFCRGAKVSQGHKHGVGRFYPRLLALEHDALSLCHRAYLNYKALLFEGKPIQIETFFVVLKPVHTLSSSHQNTNKTS